MTFARSISRDFRADRLQGELVDAFGQLPLVVGED